jgi:hypothetical protein
MRQKPSLGIGLKNLYAIGPAPHPSLQLSSSHLLRSIPHITNDSFSDKPKCDQNPHIGGFFAACESMLIRPNDAGRNDHIKCEGPEKEETPSDIVYRV